MDKEQIYILLSILLIPVFIIFVSFLNPKFKRKRIVFSDKNYIYYDSSKDKYSDND